MPINENITSAEEARQIFEILLAAKPDEQESDANCHTFMHTLHAIFEHDYNNGDPVTDASKIWLTAACVDTIQNIATGCGDAALRGMATHKLGDVGIRDAHTQTTLTTLTNILQNKAENHNVRVSAMYSLDNMASRVPYLRGSVADRLAGIVTDTQEDLKLRKMAGFFMISGASSKPLAAFVSIDSVNALTNTMRGDAEPLVCFYAGAILDKLRANAVDTLETIYEIKRNQGPAAP